ncbi:MAG: DUF3857 domain-containing transglutaminase family protein [Planctomycetota bacterium]|jgi:hypothetical protein
MTFEITAEFLENTEEIRKRIDEAGSEADHSGMNTVVVFDHTWVDVEPGGLGHVHNQRVVKILTDAGAAEMGALRFDYDPKSMVSRVKALKVHGKREGVEEVDVQDPLNFEDLPQPARGMFWGPRMFVYRLPRLRVGESVEIRTYRKGFQVAYLGASPEGGEEEITPPMPGHYYDVVLFEENVPVKEKRYTLVLPRDKPIRSDIYHGETRVNMNYGDQTIQYTWEKKDIPAIKPEKRMAFETDVKTKLVLATLKTWEEKSRWFWDANQNQFDWDEAISAKVAEITRGLSTDEEKAEALLHWVAQEIRYIGFSLGKNEGFTIHPGTMTFHERGGVCKEYGGMLVTMLRAAGLDSYPVMTQAGKKVEEIPADQFDHCFTAWKKPDGEFVLLDPTWAPFAREVYCSAEQQQNYLIGTPEGEPLGITPPKAPEVSLLRFEGASTLKADGSLESAVTITGDGRSDTNMRRALAFILRPMHGAYFAKLIEAVAPGVEILDFGFSQLDDFDRSQEYSIRFRAPEHHSAANGLLRFHLPLFRLGIGPNFCRHLEVGDLEKRKYPAMLWYTQRIVIEERLRLPRGFRLLDGASPVVVDRPPAGFEATLEQRGAELLAKAKIEFRVRLLETSAYPGFREVTQAIRDFGARTLLARK